ncbi:Uncharacterised protein [Mycobacteroides abscessus subsp. abscessus]|nr:Uncharacterised protein [Mycobacteroides abscessus subsp. abscessus]
MAGPGPMFVVRLPGYPAAVFPAPLRRTSWTTRRIPNKSNSTRLGWTAPPGISPPNKGFASTTPMTRSPRGSGAPRCWRISTRARKSRILTTSGFQSGWFMRAARAHTATSSRTTRGYRTSRPRNFSPRPVCAHRCSFVSPPLRAPAARQTPCAMYVVLPRNSIPNKAITIWSATISRYSSSKMASNFRISCTR